MKGRERERERVWCIKWGAEEEPKSMACRRAIHGSHEKPTILTNFLSPPKALTALKP
jgi:hypothetical protein